MQTFRTFRKNVTEWFFLAIWIFEQRFFEGRIFHKNEIRLMAKVKGVYTSSWYLITDVFPIFCEGIFYWIKDLWESLMRYQPVRPHELGNSSTMDPWFTPSLATSLNLWTNIVIFKSWTTWSFLEKLWPFEQDKQIPHD